MATNSTGPEVVSREEADRRAIIALARKDHRVREGELEIDDNAILSHGFDNGVYVQAWIWIDFTHTQFDKEREEADGVSSGR